MKHAIYGAVVAIFIVICISVLIFYYTQPIDANFSFKKVVTYEEITLNKDMQQYYDGSSTHYLSSAYADVGSFELVHEGSFKKLYRLPEIAGCLVLNESDQNEVPLSNYQLSVSYLIDSTEQSGGSVFTLFPGTTTKAKLIARYSGYGTPLTAFARGRIIGVALYEIPKNVKSPFDDGWLYEGRNYGSSNACNDLRARSPPLATIAVS